MLLVASAKRSGGGRRRASRSVEVLQLLLPGLGVELEDVASGVAGHARVRPFVIIAATVQPRWMGPRRWATNAAASRLLGTARRVNNPTDWSYRSVEEIHFT